MFPNSETLLEMYKDVLENPEVRAIGGWSCSNHDEPTDEAQYLEKARADLEAFSSKVDEVMALL